MRILRNHLVLFVTIGLALGVLPAVASAHVAPSARPAGQHAAAALSVTLELSTDSIKVGRAFDATGVVSDAAPGTQVRLQRGAGGTWTTVATTQTTSAGGAFALKKVVASVKGAYLYRAIAGPGTAKTSDYTWMFVAAKHPATIVSGYVQAGGPVAGSSVRVYLKNRTKPLRTTTSPNGYFLVRLPVLPKSLLVVATGGFGPIGKFKGTMTALVSKPNTDDSFYVNPATTLVAAYMTVHPQATHAAAWSKIRKLLGLKKYHNLDWALGGRPTYFDSVKFLRTAKKHGGFDAYVGHLVKGIDSERASVTFRRADVAPAGAARARRAAGDSAVTGLIGTTAAGYLGVASQGASVISGSVALLNLVGSIIGWSPGGAATPTEILGAIDQVETTLSAIQTQIANLEALVAQGVAELETKVDDAAYTSSVEHLHTAYQDVQNTQGRYANYVSDQQIIAKCVAVPPVTTPPTPLVAPAAGCTFTDPVTGKVYPLKQADIQKVLNNVGTDLQSYATSVGVLEGDIGSGTDYFHDAILANDGSTPPLSFLMDTFLDASGDIFTPYGSYVAYNFTSAALSNQAWAYYLSMMYEQSAHPFLVQGGTAQLTSISYLGSDYTSMAPFDPTADPLDTVIPTGGNLDAEVSYLQSVLPVPQGAAIDMKPGGDMYVSTANVGLASDYMPADAASRADCVAGETFGTAYACTALMNPLTSLDSDMTTFAGDQGRVWAAGPESGAPGTYWSQLETGWDLVTQGDLGAILPRLAGVNDVIAEYYFNPGPVNYGAGDGYWVHSSDWTMCEDPVNGPNGNSPDCQGSDQGHPLAAYLSPVTDWLKLYFKYIDGTDRTCTWAVGQANTNTDQCFDMPALISRPLQSGEVYVPQ
jgi:hypothetical protein